MHKKTIFISGASRGIGRSIALAFAGREYHLLLNCNTSVSELKLVREEILAVSDASCDLYPGNVGKSSDVDALFTDIIQKHHHIDILVNNAGLAHIGLLSDMSDEQWHQVIQTNLDAVFYCSRAVIPAMVAQKAGKIINISSMWGTCGASCEVAYSAAKSGVHGFTKALAKELAPSNIQVNALACGAIDTRMNAGLTAEERRALTEEIPAGRFGTADEAAAMAWNIVHSPTYMTGQIIGMDGGYL